MLNVENKYNLPQELITKDFLWEFESSILFFEDNSYFPWFILVPKNEVRNMLGLTFEERCLVMKDMEFVEKMVNTLFNPFQINVAMLGNKVPRLHIHIIARQKTDATFPASTFHIEPKPYTIESKIAILQMILNFLHLNT